MVTSKYPPKKKVAPKGGKASGTCKNCGKSKSKCNC